MNILIMDEKKKEKKTPSVLCCAVLYCAVLWCCAVARRSALGLGSYL